MRLLRLSPRSSFTQRAYASVARPKKRLDKGPLLTLEHFLQKKKALNLWREIVRALNKIPTSSTRAELHRFARGEFERQKDVTDIYSGRPANAQEKALIQKYRNKMGSLMQDFPEAFEEQVKEDGDLIRTILDRTLNG
ncbi:hypothetical protein E2P81_ATG02190 [Venturia nashicola]|uniref:Complex 1 LYR protein domain-containing protein n=1 Tax=Venturia nashicola TaxID=86259 RepID=A0A4Z1PDH9_9PEZI|nr:hypothetical protein E6O75_ATG02245 [Venturia nashicola]TLD35887.1 hypothetical protein E2P81_ATG02190 [Venturia nashicola]